MQSLHYAFVPPHLYKQRDCTEKARCREGPVLFRIMLGPAMQIFFYSCFICPPLRQAQPKQGCPIQRVVLVIPWGSDWDGHEAGPPGPLYKSAFKLISNSNRSVSSAKTALNSCLQQLQLHGQLSCCCWVVCPVDVAEAEEYRATDKIRLPYLLPAPQRFSKAAYCP